MDDPTRINHNNKFAGCYCSLSQSSHDTYTTRRHLIRDFVTISLTHSSHGKYGLNVTRVHIFCYFSRLSVTLSSERERDWPRLRSNYSLVVCICAARFISHHGIQQVVT